jgi:branched-chain amino acid transport system ATP-binding protein
VVDQVYASLAGLMKSGATIILVEQALTRAMQVASRAVCMLEGEIVLDKPIGDTSRDEVTAAYFGLGRAKGGHA